MMATIRLVHDDDPKAGADRAHAEASASTSAPDPQIAIFDPRNPMATARAIVDEHYSVGQARTLHHHRGAFYRWTGTHYERVDEAALRARLYVLLEHAGRPSEKGTEPFKPTRTKVADVYDALIAVCHLPETIEPPCWIAASEVCPPTELLACENGLLHLKTGNLFDHTPLYFNHAALAYAFDAEAPAPEALFKLLTDLWSDDQQSKDTLQEMFGYLLTPDTRQQKGFLMIGPMRSGKGTLARVITSMIGPDVVVAPTLAALDRNFGLAPLIGKYLAIIADARLSGRADQAVIAERLLTISGEDTVTIDQKYQPAWTGRLPVRFLIMTNEIPRLADTSGALASRFIVLVLERSFYGAEDHTLIDRLLAELPSILNWSIEGWRRLNYRGHFVQPEAGKAVLQELENLGSPVNAFVRDRCEVSPFTEVVCEHLFQAWKDWCDEQGHKHHGTLQTFGRDLRAVLPAIKTIRPRSGDSRQRLYQGLALR